MATKNIEDYTADEIEDFRNRITAGIIDPEDSVLILWALRFWSTQEAIAYKLKKQIVYEAQRAMYDHCIARGITEGEVEDILHG